jgi:hypothetical protein
MDQPSSVARSCPTRDDKDRFKLKKIQVPFLIRPPNSPGALRGVEMAPFRTSVFAEYNGRGQFAW